MPHVRFIERNDQVVEFEVGFGSNFFKSALARSLPLFNGPLKVLHCWGKGYCGACFVEILSGAGRLPERTAVERKKLRGLPDSIRLACQVRLTGDVVIRKPRGVLRPRLERSEAALGGAAVPAAIPAPASGPAAGQLAPDATAAPAAVQHAAS
jgi:ferredoxin